MPIYSFNQARFSAAVCVVVGISPAIAEEEQQIDVPAQPLPSAVVELADETAV